MCVHAKRHGPMRSFRKPNLILDRFPVLPRIGLPWLCVLGVDGLSGYAHVTGSLLLLGYAGLFSSSSSRTLMLDNYQLPVESQYERLNELLGCMSNRL